MTSVKIHRKENSKTLLICNEKNGVTYLTFEGFGDDKMCYAYSTRLGGVSKGSFAEMNLSFTRGDDDGCVLENYKRMAGVLGAKAEDIVCTYQTHTTNIRQVSAADRGKGVVRERDYTDVDGLVTDERGIVLSIFAADCVPLLFYDPVHAAVGAAHAGWRGSVDNMAEKMVRAMNLLYGTDPADLQCAIGPSICADCYEVSEDVATEVRRAVAHTSCVSCEQAAGCGFSRAPAQEHTMGKSTGHVCTHTDFQKKLETVLQPGAHPGKYQLDLWALNRLLLETAGVQPERIFTTDLCTKCNPEFLFSHRAMGAQRGSLAAFITVR